MKIKFNALVACALFGLALGWPASPLSAQEKKETSGPAGTWKSTFTTPNGDPVENTLKLKLEGDTLTGVFIGADGRESAIEDGKFKDGEISFSVTRQRNGQKVNSKHQGKLNGDTIKGKMESNFGGEKRALDWEAKRDDGKANVSGTWRYAIPTAGGQSFEPTLRLKQQDDKITGVIVWGENEAPISEGTIKDNEVSFKVDRERDGQTFSTKYLGKVTSAGDLIKGKMESNWGGIDRTYDWDAKKIRGGR